LLSFLLAVQEMESLVLAVVDHLLRFGLSTHHWMSIVHCPVQYAADLDCMTQPLFMLIISQCDNSVSFVDPSSRYFVPVSPRWRVRIFLLGESDSPNIEKSSFVSSILLKLVWHKEVSFYGYAYFK